VRGRHVPIQKVGERFSKLSREEAVEIFYDRYVWFGCSIQKKRAGESIFYYDSYLISDYSTFCGVGFDFSERRGAKLRERSSAVSKKNADIR